MGRLSARLLLVAAFGVTAVALLAVNRGCGSAGVAHVDVRLVGSQETPFPGEPTGVDLFRSETYVVAAPYRVVEESLMGDDSIGLSVLYTSDDLELLRAEMEVVDTEQMVTLARSRQLQSTQRRLFGTVIETVEGDLLFWHRYAYIPRECRFVVFGRDDDRLVVIQGLARAPGEVRFSDEHTTVVVESRRRANWFDLVLLRIRRALR
ncbi:MAG: hypothetical protein AB1725_09225 [Armatimonadota bacterium]